jgi:hypothetical protein
LKEWKTVVKGAKHERRPEPGAGKNNEKSRVKGMTRSKMKRMEEFCASRRRRKRATAVVQVWREG